VSEPELILERDELIAQVTLNRPNRLNALSSSLLDGLRALWSELGADQGLRCVIITGAGRGFCAGADMELLGSDRSEAPLSVRDELSFLPRGHLDVPIITAVNGVCAGGGLHFVADADIVIGARSSTFLDPHVFAGQVSGLEPVTLMMRMRPDVLRRMVLLGRDGRLDAGQAYEAGILSEVVEDDRLDARAAELASIICAASPAALRSSLRVLRGFERRLLDESLQAAWESVRAHWAHPDAREGPAAFLEGRDPTWSTLDAANT
jgi:enoyl-CoA hydratase/carnithine racemase